MSEWTFQGNFVLNFCTFDCIPHILKGNRRQERKQRPEKDSSLPKVKQKVGARAELHRLSSSHVHQVLVVRFIPPSYFLTAIYWSFASWLPVLLQGEDI